MLQERTQDDAGRWGVSIIRVEVQNIIPPSDIKQAMENQIIGERERRSAVLQADGERESAIIRSRGEAAQVLNLYHLVLAVTNSRHVRLCSVRRAKRQPVF